MAQKSFAQHVRDILTEDAGLRGGEVTATRLSIQLGMMTAKEHKRLLNTLSDLTKSGRIVRVRQGVYAPAIDSRQPDKREVMWRVLRMRRVVCVADLVELAGVAESYAAEWIAMLAKRNIVSTLPPPTLCGSPVWRLIDTSLVEMPVDEDKAARLRELRKKKKETLRKVAGLINTAGTALDTLRGILKTMEEDDV